MGMQIINNIPQNSGLGDTLYEAFNKVNENFAELDNKENLILTSLSELSNDMGFITLDNLPEIKISDIEDLGTKLNKVIEVSEYNLTDISTIQSQIMSLNTIINKQNQQISDLYTIINNL
jgi:hypothetical protein